MGINGNLVSSTCVMEISRDCSPPLRQPLTGNTFSISIQTLGPPTIQRHACLSWTAESDLPIVNECQCRVLLHILYIGQGGQFGLLILECLVFLGYVYKCGLCKHSTNIYKCTKSEHNTNAWLKYSTHRTAIVFDVWVLSRPPPLCDCGIVVWSFCLLLQVTTQAEDDCAKSVRTWCSTRI